VVQGLADVEHRSARDPGRRQRGDHLVPSLVGQRRLHFLAQPLTVLSAFGVAAEAGVLDPLGVAERTGELGEQPVVGHRDGDRVVAGGEGAERGADRVVAAGRPDRLVDVLAPSGARPLVQRRQHGGRGVHARHDVTDADADPRRRAAVASGHRQQPRHRLDDQVVGGLVRQRPGAAVAADADGHQARVDLQQPGGGEAETVQDAGPEVLDEHVGASDELGEPLAARV
jgi:hypothetical protein